MPGASTFLNDVDLTIITEAPKTVKLWLPSQPPPNSRNKSCINGLPNLEFRLWLAQAYNALDLIRHFCGVYQALLLKNQVHISSSQGTTTKAKALFMNFTLKIDQVAACYHDACVALLQLDPDEKLSQWKEDLRDLCQEDVCSPSCEVNKLLELHQQVFWIWRTTLS